MAIPTFVVFRWKPPAGYRKTFGAEQVNIHRRMVRRFYPAPHRYVLITDDALGVTEPDIEVFELWKDLAHVQNPNGAANPSCYRRLRLFARNTGEWLGERIVLMDLDCVIVGDMRPLIDREEDFVIWENPTKTALSLRRKSHVYNGGFWMLRAGTRPQVWEDFDPVMSPQATRAAGLFGSDQAWIAHRLGGGEKMWTPKDGVYSWKFHIKAHHGERLPSNARIVFFHGAPDAHSPEVYDRIEWVRKFYR